MISLRVTVPPGHHRKAGPGARYRSPRIQTSLRTQRERKLQDASWNSSTCFPASSRDACSSSSRPGSLQAGQHRQQVYLRTQTEKRLSCPAARQCPARLGSPAALNHRSVKSGSFRSPSEFLRWQVCCAIATALLLHPAFVNITSLMAAGPNVHKIKPACSKQLYWQRLRLRPDRLLCDGYLKSQVICQQRTLNRMLVQIGLADTLTFMERSYYEEVKTCPRCLRRRGLDGWLILWKNSRWQGGERDARFGESMKFHELWHFRPGSSTSMALFCLAAAILYGHEICAECALHNSWPVLLSGGSTGSCALAS